MHAPPPAQDTIVFSADEVQPERDRRAKLAAGAVPLGIGAGSQVRRAILDRNVRVGRRARLLNAAGVREGGGRSALPRGVVIREGIICVAKNAVLPDDTAV
jgi:glucose-1-phosphate adenylyltransferase